jgi:hypothetical protein
MVQEKGKHRPENSFMKYYRNGVKFLLKPENF